MAFTVHTIERPDGDQSTWPDRSFMGHQFGITVSGGTSPQAIAVTWPGLLPTNYMVDVEVNVPAATAVAVSATVPASLKTSSGFTVELASSSAIPAGTINVRVTG